jgi:mannose-6-phosphate isomerase-like protein (cupin superfamily)
VIVERKSLTSIAFDGLTVYDYTAGQPLASSVAVVEVPPGAKHAEAWSRRSDKYYLCTEGEVEFVLDGDTFTLARGDFCVVQRGRHFSYSNRRSALATLVLVHTPSFQLSDEVFVERG